MKPFHSPFTRFQMAFAEAVEKPQDPLGPEVIPIGFAQAGELGKPEDAIRVYQNAYPARLTEALGETFEATWWVLGDEDFFSLTQKFIRQYSSNSYSLNDYGLEWPDFLDGQLEENDDRLTEIPFLPFLARFEWFFKEVFHSQSNQPLSPQHWACLESQPNCSLEFGKSSWLIEHPMRVFPIWKLRKQSPEGVEFPDWRSLEFLLVSKSDHGIMIQELNSTEMNLIRSLKEGIPLGKLLDPDFHPESKDLTPEQVGRTMQLLVASNAVTGLIQKPNT